MFNIIGHRDGKVIASESVDTIDKANLVRDSWRELCDSVFVAVDLTAAIASVDRITSAVNSDHRWLTIEPTPRPDGRVDLVANINGRFDATSDSSSPADVAKAMASVFGSMHAAVVSAANGDFGDRSQSASEGVTA